MDQTVSAGVATNPDDTPPCKDPLAKTGDYRRGLPNTYAGDYRKTDETARLLTAQNAYRGTQGGSDEIGIVPLCKQGDDWHEC